MKPIKDNNKPEISRKEALKKIGNYGKYTALTALGTYMILNPKKAQAASDLVSPDTDFGSEDDFFD
tara:strand:- start:98 stop:295 length:198 start_codon:yes stop_codon:yes gene_type:complete